MLFRHAFKNALLPLITSIGFSIGNFFGGSIVIEQVFGINGMGRMMLSALREKDIPTVMAGVIITAIMIALGNLVADLLYGVVDPRIRAVYTSGGKKLKVMECRAVASGGEAPGTVLATKPLTVACGEGAIQLLNVVPEGKKPMDGTAFAAGQRLKTGDIL